MAIQLLIVDDDVTLCQHLRHFFESQQYNVAVANDGPSALALAEQIHPHLMFLDIGLPGMSGIEVLKRIKERDPAIRVIMVTGQTEDELVRQSRALGSDDYVTKPFTLDYLNGEVLSKLHHQLFYDLRSTSSDLAIEREKAELLFEQVQEGVMLLNPQGHLYMVNPVARQVLGLSQELSHHKAAQCFEGFTTSPADVFARLNDQTGIAFDAIRDIPKKLILQCRINPIVGRKQERYGYLLLFRDVTQERKAENAMHRFISLISHKLRTPLVTIRAYPKLLLSENAVHPLSDFQRSALQVIAKQCRRLEDMVNQLIAFSSLDEQELLYQPVTVADLIKEAIKILPEEMMHLSDKIHIIEEAGKFYVNVDPTLIQHALRNIIENAFKFGATDVTVHTESLEKHIQIRIEDNGRGIPPEDRERVFERFYQVEKDFSGQVPGTGLGLTMVKQTIEAHGGKVWVESTVGKGSIFFVTLPKAQAAAN